jgi:hypothetical protein
MSHNVSNAAQATCLSNSMKNQEMLRKMLKATLFQDANGVISQEEVQLRSHHCRTNIIGEVLYHVGLVIVVYTSEF